MSVQGGAEDTGERVLSLHTEMCDKGGVTSVEEGRDVQRVTSDVQRFYFQGCDVSCCQAREED